MVELTERQAIARLQQNEARLGQLQAQLDSIARAIDELRLTRATLKNMPEGEASGLLPLGGVMIPVKTLPDKVKVNVGAKVVIEQTRGEAIKTLEKREAALTEALRKTREAGGEIAAESLQIQKKLEERRRPSVPVVSG